MAQLAIAAGIMAASYAIDYFTRPKVTTPPVDKGRYDDVRVQGSDYGAAIPIIIGKMRVAGQVVWGTKIRHTVTTTPGSPGGKGGSPTPPTPATNYHHYFTNLGIIFAQGPHAYAPSRLWENESIIFNGTTEPPGEFGDQFEAEEGSLGGQAQIAADSSVPSGAKVSFIGGPSNPGTLTFTIESEGGVFMMGFVYACATVRTLTVTIDGGTARNLTCQPTGSFSAWRTRTLLVSLTPGTHTIVCSGNASYAPDIDKLVLNTYERPETDPILTEQDSPVTTGVINPVGTFPANLDNPLPFYNEEPTVSAQGVASLTLTSGGLASVRTFRGTSDQPVDSLISTELGTKAQAYRFRVGCIIDDYEIQNGALPIYTAECQEGTTTVKTAVEILYGLVDTPTSQLSLAALANIPFAGCILYTRQEARQKLNELQVAYNFDLPEVGDKIKAVVRGGASAATIDQADMRAHVWREDSPAFALNITRIEERALPRRVTVGYIDAALDYHNNTQSAHRQTGKTEDNIEVNLGIVLTADQAATIAYRLLYAAHLERTQYEWVTSYKWLKLHPCDVVTLSMNNGAQHRVRVTEMQYGMPGLIRFKGVADDEAIYTHTTKGARPDGYERPITVTPANLHAVFADLPPLRKQDVGTNGFYVGMCARANGMFRGGFLYKERNTGSGAYELKSAFAAEATIGKALTALPAVTDITKWDDTNFVDVGLYNGTLSSSTKANILKDSTLNVILIGGEPIQFVTATPLAVAAGEPYESKYRLSGGLLRGRAGASYAVTGHAIGDGVMLMNSAVKYLNEDLSERGRARNWKAVNAGQQLENAAVISFTWAANVLKPLPPSHLLIKKSSDQDLYVTWDRTARVGGLLDSTGVTLDDEDEKYLVECYIGGVKKRSIAVTPGVNQAAVFQAETPHTTVSKNTVKRKSTAPKAVPAIARSFQQLTGPGSFAEFDLDLHSSFSDTFVAINLAPANTPLGQDAWPGYWAYVAYQSFNPITGVWTGDGLLGHGAVNGLLGGFTFSESARYRFMWVGSEMRVYQNYVNNASKPIYIYKVAPVQGPYVVRAHIKNNFAAGSVSETAQVEAVIMGGVKAQSTIYSKEQIIEDNGGTYPAAGLVTIKVAQVSRTVGAGYSTSKSI